jgi:hypothetical protein
MYRYIEHCITPCSIGDLGVGSRAPGLVALQEPW